MASEHDRRRLLARVEAILRTKAAREAVRTARITQTRAERDATTTMIHVRVPKTLRDEAARMLRRHDVTLSDAVRALLAAMVECDRD